jgi:hypothetical protein
LIKPAALLISLSLGSAASFAATVHPWKISTSINRYVGDYGEDTETKTTLIPVKLTRYFSVADLWLTLPYVSVTGDGTVTAVSGGRGRGRGARPQNAVTTSERSEGGLGDIVVGAHRIFWDENDRRPEIGASAFVKAPTADEDKGLGTGEWDEGVRLELFKSFPRDWFGMLDLGYTWTGDAAEFDYNDKWLASLGAGRPLTPRLTTMVFFTEERALISGNENPIDVTGTLNFSATPEAAFYLGLLLGLSDGAPDTGLSAGGSMRFGGASTAQPSTSRRAAPNSKSIRFPLSNSN